MLYLFNHYEYGGGDCKILSHISTFTQEELKVMTTEYVSRNTSMLSTTQYVSMKLKNIMNLTEFFINTYGFEQVDTVTFGYNIIHDLTNDSALADKFQKHEKEIDLETLMIAKREYIER